MRRLHAMLLFYPGGVKKIEHDYPGIRNAINGNCDAGDVTPAHSAVMIAGFVLANKFEILEPSDRKALRTQVGQVNLAAFKEALRSGAQLPTEMMAGTSLVALAFIMAEAALKDGEITEHQFKSFTSEVIGALEGKNSNQRSSERMRDILDETIGPPPLRDGDDDPSEILPSVGWSGELPELNGTECKVRMVYTATGFALVRKEDGAEITERRSLTQQDLEKVKRENWEECTYVNLHTRSGEIVSCLIVGNDHEIVGNPRAFWWTLAKVSVKMTDVRLWNENEHPCACTCAQRGAGAMPTRCARVGKIARNSSANGYSSASDFAHPTGLSYRRRYSRQQSQGAKHRCDTHCTSLLHRH